MYLYHYSMSRLPFCLTPDTQLYVSSKSHDEALNVVLFATHSGEAFCKLVGEVGSGKTMICRMLLNALDGKRQYAYIPNSKLNARELRFSLARELGLRIGDGSREDQINQRIQTRLLNLNKKHGPVVLVIDEAQALSDDALEALRLFSNIETERRKLLQIILFGQPELDQKLRRKHLRQLQQRISFSYRLKPLSAVQVTRYVVARLAAVSQNKPVKMSPLTGWVLYHYSRGIPRLVNILCHKSLLLGFGQKIHRLSLFNLLKAVKDTESVKAFWLRHFGLALALGALTLSTSAYAVWSLL